jgi:Xaa-Pro aminopeptidase
MRFENLTMVPWELDAVVPELLNHRERELLNEYHAMVYRTISPYLEGEEKEWLRDATRAV